MCEPKHTLEKECFVKFWVASVESDERAAISLCIRQKMAEYPQKP